MRLTSSSESNSAPASTAWAGTTGKAGGPTGSLPVNAGLSSFVAAA